MWFEEDEVGEVGPWDVDLVAKAGWVLGKGQELSQESCSGAQGGAEELVGM
ncbi:MAG: hypothetical protein IPL28_06335 [Chloroflexi bacterium]|nr:hypothetical protein [Chloroflexota bacterium]